MFAMFPLSPLRACARSPSRPFAVALPLSIQPSSCYQGFARGRIELDAAHSAAVRTSTVGFDHRPGHQRRPVAECRPRRGPAGRVAGDPGRAGGDQRCELAAKPLDGRAIRITNRDAQDHLPRAFAGRADSRNHVAGAEALDQRIGEREPRPAHALEDASPRPRGPFSRHHGRPRPACRWRSSRRDRRSPA